MIKLFFWKILACTLPVLVCLFVIWKAREEDRIKYGVDLVGGTILVYEIDLRKLEDKSGQNSESIATNLAEKLKNRIDPTDLFNVVIRPGKSGRVEIILPTGGTRLQEKYQEEWDQVLRQMEAKYPNEIPPKSLKVPRGQVQMLGDKIQQMVQQKRWENEIYKTPESRRELIERALDGSEELQLTPLYELYDRRLGALTGARTVGLASGGLLEVMPFIKAGMVRKDQISGKEAFSAGRMRDLFLYYDRRLGALTGARTVGLASGGLLEVMPFIKAGMVRKDQISGKEAFSAGRMRDLFMKRIDKPGDDKAKEKDIADRVGLFFNVKQPLHDLIAEVKAYVDDNRKNREVDSWFKQQAWRKTIGMVLEKWPLLKERKAAFEKIAPDAIDELVGRAECKGDSVGQAFLFAAEPLVGKRVLADRSVEQIKDAEEAKDKFISGAAVEKFVLATYGPSTQIVEKQIDQFFKPGGYTRDATVEQVQNIKELVSKVGSLEFVILANSRDDADAIRDARAMLNSAEDRPELKRSELEEDQNIGVPPPPPRDQETREPKKYTIKLRGGNSEVTYRWVELGMQERQTLGLNNNAVQEGKREAWSYLNAHRRLAEQIPATDETSSDKKLLEGALFYSRECRDRNMPEEQRRVKKYEYFILVRNPEIVDGKETPRITGDYLVSAMNQPGNDGRPAVAFAFNAQGGRLFGDLTRKNTPDDEASGRSVKRLLAIILDGMITSAATVNSEIREHGQITGNFTNREVDQLVNVLRAGALPATLKPQPVSENTMGATLGKDTIEKGGRAIIIAFVVVLLFMIVYYRFAGLVASVALMANLVLTVGFMVAVNATFTLPGLAGLVLMLGMAVDANILIYERLREERDRGASILLALRNGYDRALPTIIDTHLSSIFTAIVLYVVGNDQLKGFGVSMTVGLLISLYTSLFVTRVIFDLWAAMGWLKKLGMFRLFSRPDIDFMSIRYYLFAATGILTVLGGALFIGRLPDDLNIDFVGGTAYKGQLVEAKAKTIEELRALVGDDNQNARLKSAKAREIDEGNLTYELWYGSGDASDKSMRTVLLANKPVVDTPEGDTPEERAKIVAKRASTLPDWAVEQIFIGNEDAGSGRSSYFTVRTTEKEPDLVQAVLDRLLQYEEKGQWKPLLKKVHMTYDVAKLLEKGQETRIRFFASKPDGSIDEDTETPASPSFITTLLTRQLRTAFGIGDRSKHDMKLPFTFELTNDDADPSADGRFKRAILTFTSRESALRPEDIQKIKEALDKTKSEFQDRPQPEGLETFDSQLAAETRVRAMQAILLSWMAILGYLWVRFGSWTFGLAAVLCLIHDLFFTLGAIAICHQVNLIWPGFLGIEDFKIDLPAVAALLTLVGYSVNDTIVVFDRIREVRGKNPDLTPQMINDSVNQTLSRTLLSSLTTWLVVIVLYVAGGPGVHLFAFVMVVGVVVGTYSSIYVASPLLLLFGEGTRSGVRSGGGPNPQIAPETRIQPAAT